MSQVSAPMPVHDAIAEPRNPVIPQGKKDPKEGQCTDVWRKWLQDLVGQTQTSTQVKHTVVASGLSAAVSSGNIALVTNAGFYRVNLYARVTQPATVSSSLLLTVRWVDGGVACSYANPAGAQTGNTTNSTQSLVWCGHVDGSTEIQYDIDYASTGSLMLYSLFIALEEVSL